MRYGKEEETECGREEFAKEYVIKDVYEIKTERILAQDTVPVLRALELVTSSRASSSRALKLGIAATELRGYQGCW